MKMADIKICIELRDCTVNGKPGLFHCWEHYSNPVGESPLIGGPPAGVISFVRGIVEFPEGMGYCSPADIKFTDDTHTNLCSFAKFLERDGGKNA